MKEQLEAIRKGALESIAGTKATADLEALRVRYLGKKGELTAVLKQMGWPPTSAPVWKKPLRPSPLFWPKRRWKPNWMRKHWT